MQLKRAVALLMFLCLVARLAAHYGVVGYYELNKEYIAKNLCENRDKPQMNCCGKCYLNKQLKKVDGKDESPSKDRPYKSDKQEPAIAFLLPAPASIVSCLPTEEQAACTPGRQHLHGLDAGRDVFHPPAA